MKPLKHAHISAKKFGGEPEDYQHIHDWMDHTKAHIPDVRHRMLLHNSWGCYIVEQVFGTFIVNSTGNKVSVRDIAEQHVIDDLGHIPSLNACFSGLKLESWMGGNPQKRKPMYKMLKKEN